MDVIARGMPKRREREAAQYNSYGLDADQVVDVRTAEIRVKVM